MMENNLTIDKTVLQLFEAQVERTPDASGGDCSAGGFPGGMVAAAELVGRLDQYPQWVESAVVDN